MDISEKNLEDTIEQSLSFSEVVAPLDVPDSVLHQPPPLYGPATSKKRRSRTMIPTIKTVQTIARAYQQICAGEDPWIALGNFRNAWYSYAKDNRLALVNDPLTEPEHNTEHTRRWGAFCAASVEFLCGCYSVPCPDWVHHPCYTLTTPWWPEHTYDLSDRLRLMQITPTPFVQRHIFCGNRLYQINMK